MYNQFYTILDDILKYTLDKNIIIYGCNRGGDFIKWFYQKYYNKDIKSFIDRWELSTVATIPHLMAFYYMYDHNDIIINVTPHCIMEEFNDIGEDWTKVKYKEKQIINLWNKVYGSEYQEIYPEITYFDWLEYTYKIDLLTTVKRKFTTGTHSHGYYPTDFRIFIDGLSKYQIGENDAILDIGCGKGGGVIALNTVGFSKIGAVEYTESIYRILDDNLNKLRLEHTNISVKDINETQDKVICYSGDATLLSNQLDYYNWFFLFNPFSWDIMEKVLENICNSLKRHPRKAYIFYAEPMGHELIMCSGMFLLKDKLCGNYSDVSYCSYIYESINQL